MRRLSSLEARVRWKCALMIFIQESGGSFGEEIIGEDFPRRESFERGRRRKCAADWEYWLGECSGAAGSSLLSESGRRLASGSIRPRRRKCGNAVIDLEAFVGAVALVAGKEFIAAVAGKQRFYALFAGHFGAQIGTDGGGICEGLIVILGDFWNGLDGVARAEAEFVVLGVEEFSGGAGIADFVVTRLGKVNRERARGIEFFGEKGGDAAAVRTAAEIRAGGFRAQALEMTMDGAAHSFANFFGPVGFGAGNFVVIEIPVGLVADFAFFKNQAIAGTQLFDALITGERRGDYAEEQKLHDRSGIHFVGVRLRGDDGASARGEEETIALAIPVETLNAQAIDGEDEALSAFVENRQRECAVQPGDERGAFFA